MKILVTAGNTQVPIDRVRCITNIFTGSTGAGIALVAADRGHDVTLLTSHPEVLERMTAGAPPLAERGRVVRYTYFDELAEHMAREIGQAGYDAVIHSAAVSDYRVVSIHAPAAGTSFDPATGQWRTDGGPAQLVDMMAGKVKSNADQLWLRLERTPKLVDRIRRDWGFKGIVVKFKLEVGVSVKRLLEIAEESRRHSQAELMVANTLEESSFCAYIGPVNGQYEKVSRGQLAPRLLECVEQLHGE